MLIINFIGFLLSLYTKIPIVGIILIGILIIINVQLKDRLFKNVNWSKVTEISDFQLWNMWLISKASDVKITRQKKYSMFQKIGIGKKPFTYLENNIYNRLWVHYFGKNYGLLMQAIGAVFLMLTVFLFFNEILFFIGLVIAIYVYTTVLAIFFRSQFEENILRVLPWNLSVYKRAFFKWVMICGIILLIPIVIFLGMNVSMWTPFQLLFYGSVFLYIYHVKIDKAILLLGKQPIKTDVDEAIGILLLAGVFFSGKYPVIVLGFIIVIWLLLRRRNKFA